MYVSSTVKGSTVCQLSSHLWLKCEWVAQYVEHDLQVNCKGSLAQSHTERKTEAEGGKEAGGVEWQRHTQGGRETEEKGKREKEAAESVASWSTTGGKIVQAEENRVDAWISL